MNNKNNNSKKISDDVNDFSRVTGAKIEMLRRFINRTARDARSETWDKIYTSLKPFLVGESMDNADEPPPRLGPGYRRHEELVAMTSNQKVLLDEFVMLSETAKTELLKHLNEISYSAPATEYKSLTDEENQLMGYFTALDPKIAEEELLKITAEATAELHRLRQELI